MDWHFKRNSRGKKKGTVPPSRRWNMPLKEWVQHNYSEVEEEKPAPSVFDALDATGVTPTASNASAELPESVIRAPPNTTRVVCFKCSEEVAIFWDAASEEWMLRDATYATDGSGQICHASCSV